MPTCVAMNATSTIMIGGFVADGLYRMFGFKMPIGCVREAEITVSSHLSVFSALRIAYSETILKVAQGYNLRRITNQRDPQKYQTIIWDC